jgi:TonB family protein
VRGDGVKAEDKHPQPPATWQPTSDKLSAEREPDPTNVGENGSPTMRPERLLMADIRATPKSRTRSPDKNLISLFRALRLHGNQLFHSTKRSLIIAKQSAQQKFAAIAASRKTKKEARDLANLRSLLLIDFWPSEQAEEAQLRAADEVGRQAEETRRHTDASARIKAEQEHQQTHFEQTRLQAEEETRRAEGTGRHAAALARIEEAEQERRQAQAEQTRLKAEEEARRAEEARRHAETQARIKAEQERQQAQAEQTRLKAEEETRRAEEARRHAETQVRIKAEQERQQAQAEQALLQAEKESLKDSENKHCPKCKRVFSSDRDYCLYDAAWLVSATDASLSPAVKPEATTGPVVWILVIITFLGAGILGHQILNYIPNEPRSATEETSQSNVEQPVVGGALNGKETILPNPDYPESAKREGVSGRVTVAILVDRKGTVRSARALNGHPLLQMPAVAAAKKAKFEPAKLTSQPPRTSGTITYNFKL